MNTIFDGTGLDLGELQHKKEGNVDCYYLDLPDAKVPQWNKFGNGTIRPRVDAIRGKVLTEDGFGFGTRLDAKKAA